MDYGKTAKEILEKVGGSKNIVSAAHMCNKAPSGYCRQ